MTKEKSIDLNVEDLAAYCRQKGFVYKSSDIYGGVSGVYDYGHIGTLLKKNFENLWRRYFSSLNENFYEIDTGVIMHENVFKASGHLENFFDPIVEIEGFEQTFRADHVIEEKKGIRAEELSIDEMQKIIVEEKLLGDKIEGKVIDYSKLVVKELNMMFDVHMGPKKGTTAYLRPETAQSPFVNFKTQFELQRKKLPMGTLLIGRVFRNEISPRNMLLRTRELEQAELQIFFNPNTLHDKLDFFDEIKDFKLPVMLKDKRDQELDYMTPDELISYGVPEMYVCYLVKVAQFYKDEMGIYENIRFLELNDQEKAFYNKNHFDIECYVHSTKSWVEIGGVHYRTDHDLSGHQRVSKISMEVRDESRQEKVLPHVLELSFGVGRNVFALLDNLVDDDGRGNKVLFIPPKLSPIYVAICPLMNKPELMEVAQELFNEMDSELFKVVLDKSGSIGKRYARYDEIGTSFCVTIDYDTIDGENKGTVTIRDRNSKEQKRVQIDELYSKLLKVRNGKLTFDEF